MLTRHPESAALGRKAKNALESLRHAKRSKHPKGDESAVQNQRIGIRLIAFQKRPGLVFFGGVYPLSTVMGGGDSQEYFELPMLGMQPLVVPQPSE